MHVCNADIHAHTLHAPTRAQTRTHALKATPTPAPPSLDPTHLATATIGPVLLDYEQLALNDWPRTIGPELLAHERLAQNYWH